MNKKRRNNIIIGTLCVVVLIMAVGYAAFSTLLDIEGTSNISSNWNVHFDENQTDDIEGVVTRYNGATNSEVAHGTTGDNVPTGIIEYLDKLSVNLTANLVQPKDSVTFNLIVVNDGTLDAILNDVKVSEGNEVVRFTFSMIKDGIEVTDIEQMKNTKLKVNEKAYFKIKMEFLEGVELTEENMTVNSTVTLDYGQANLDKNGIAIPGISADDIIENVVTEGDGLYEDEYEEGRYIYKGGNPNNYITFNNEIWRILSIENDGTIKIMRSTALPARAWDTSSSNNWARPATLNTYLNNEYYNTLSTDAKDQIASHTWSIGKVTYYNTDLTAQIASEKGTTWNGKIGLMTASEYLRANTNITQCGNFRLNNSNDKTCKTTNYIFLSVPSSGWLWTISPDASHSDIVFHVISTGSLYNNYRAHGSRYSPAPALYLKSNITLSGEGTRDNPYTIVE